MENKNGIAYPKIINKVKNKNKYYYYSIYINLEI